jgi:hypothetical protein
MISINRWHVCVDQWRLASYLSFILSHIKGVDQKRSGIPQKLFILRGKRIKSHRTYHSSFEQWCPNEAPLIRLFLKILKENDIFKILNYQVALQKRPIYPLKSSKPTLNIV